jgi:hypothetical protein
MSRLQATTVVNVTLKNADDLTEFNDQIRIVGSYFCSNGYTTYLLMMLSIKRKTVEGER